MCNLLRVLPLTETNFGFIHGDVATMANLNPFNIILMYDAAFEPELMYKISDLVDASSTPLIIVSTRKLTDYDFHVVLLDQVPIRMTSGEGKTARIYRYYLYH